MTLVGLAARKLAQKQRSAKLAAAFPNGVRCQKCLNLGHWSYECKEKRKYVHRSSRTKQLSKHLAEKTANAGETLTGNEARSVDAGTERQDRDKRAKLKRRRSNSSSSSSTSDSSNSSSDSSNSDSSSSDDSDSSSSDDGSSSDGESGSSSGSESDGSSSSSKSSDSSSNERDSSAEKKKGRESSDGDA